jgi:hypothetical protein
MGRQFYLLTVSLILLVTYTAPIYAQTGKDSLEILVKPYASLRGIWQYIITRWNFRRMLPELE